MKKAYLYPISKNPGQIFPSAYIKNFMDYLKGDFHFLNRPKPSNKGILDLIYYINQIEYIFLNWIEDLPDKRGGILQSYFFFIIVYVLKAKKVRIVWVMHNKESHYQSNIRLKKRIYNFIIKKSDHIITHAKDGIDFYNQTKIQDKDKIRYFPHPLNKDFINLKEHPAIDILIWGAIIPYKGIDIFLKYLHENDLQNNYSILIAGKVKPESYVQTIDKYCNKNIRLINRFIPVEELKSIISDTRSILFTYIADSVLSSGALMDSLSYGVNVLAPHVGAFKDAQEEGLIKTCKDFDQLIVSIDTNLKSSIENTRIVINKFIDEHNWLEFSNKITKWIK